MIKNPLYRGVVCFGNDEFKGQHAALVSSETWEQANAAIAEAKRSRQPQLRHADKYSNMLKGVVRCMTCGTPLFSNASGKARGDGTAYRYYICRRKRGSPNSLLTWKRPGEGAGNGIVGFLREMATDGKTMDLLSGRASDLNYKEVRARADLAEANSTLLSLDRKISNCVDALESGGASGINPELLQRIESLRSRKQEILVCRAKAQIELDALEARAPNSERVKKAAERLRLLLPTLSSIEQRKLVRHILLNLEIIPDPAGSYRQSGRYLGLRVHVGVSRLTVAMERDTMPADRRLAALARLDIHEQSLRFLDLRTSFTATECATPFAPTSETLAAP